MYEQKSAKNNVWGSVYSQIQSIRGIDIYNNIK